MELNHAILCVDCEWLYAQQNSCPRCGSHVAFPLARALDRKTHAVAAAATLPINGHHTKLIPVGAAVVRLHKDADQPYRLTA